MILFMVVQFPMVVKLQFQSSMLVLNMVLQRRGTEFFQAEIGIVFSTCLLVSNTVKLKHQLTHWLIETFQSQWKSKIRLQEQFSQIF